MSKLTPTMMIPYYSYKLGYSKLESYNFLRDYGNLDSFKDDNQFVFSNIDTDLEGYTLSQFIIDTYLENILDMCDNDNIKLFYSIILYNIERNINVYMVAESLNINDTECQVNRLKAIVHMFHLNYYQSINGIHDCIESRENPMDALADIYKFNKPNGLSIIKDLWKRVKKKC